MCVCNRGRTRKLEKMRGVYVSVRGWVGGWGLGTGELVNAGLYLVLFHI